MGGYVILYRNLRTNEIGYICEEGEGGGVLPDKIAEFSTMDEIERCMKGSRLLQYVEYQIVALDI